MEVILVLLIVAILNGAVIFIDEMLSGLVPMTLNADQYMTAVGGGSMVSVLFDILLGFGVSLIILKFLKKGFECYVMWTDGDPDAEPAYLVIRFIQAIAVAVCFPVMYGWLILRIGLPLACVGLLDSDKGIFKTYINKFFQTTFAVVVQICLCKLGVGMMMNVSIMNIFWGIACIVLAIKTPRFLSEFMVPTGGGGAGVINNMYHSVRLVGMAKGMVK